MFLTLDKGPMFSGKTTALIARFNKYKNKRIGVFKHCFDTRRGTSYINTHDGKCIPCTSISDLTEINLDLYDVVIIDEAQFFTGLESFIRSNFHRDINVHIAGLNGDKHQHSFGEINDISPLCSEEILHRSICSKCDRDAPFSVKLTMSDEIIDIGGSDKYTTLCDKCI